MSIRKQDIAVLIFHRLGFSSVRAFALRLRGKAVSRFVTFHDVPQESTTLFSEHLEFLKKHTNVVSLDDHFHGRLSTKKINVVITFDDGYKSWATTAAPLLRKLRLPATFFVASGFVGTPEEAQMAFLRDNLLLSPESAHATRGLSQDELRGLADQGFVIGGHTVNHRDLSSVRDRQSLWGEIADDKKTLERLTGTPVEYFAYPFGTFTNPHLDVASVVKEAGYRGAVTTMSGFNTPDTDPFLLHRELTPSSMAASVFRARAYGDYDAVRFVKRHLGVGQRV